MTRWTERKCQTARLHAKARYEATPEPLREEWKSKGRATYAEKYPERIALSSSTKALIESGELVPGPCRDCGGGKTAPEFDYVNLRLSGWSHYDCRKKRLR